MKEILSRMRNRALAPVLDALRGCASDIESLSYKMDSMSSDLGGLVGGVHKNINDSRTTLFEKVEYEREVIEGAILTKDSHTKMLLWEMFRGGGESLNEARRRFFRSIPKAPEGRLRNIQQGNLKLLKIFDGICADAGLSYWIMFGTLLGSCRHSGFVPWDDDVDVCMMREDVEALARILKDDSRYRLAIAYDYGARSRQLRFASRDEALPCWVDVFPCDWAFAREGDNVQDRYRSMREEVKKRLSVDRGGFSYWKERLWLFTNGFTPQVWPIKGMQDQRLCEEESARIDLLLLNAWNEAHREGLFVPEAKANALAFGLDNISMDDGVPSVFSREKVFPLRDMSFEGEVFKGPSEPEALLALCYGDWLDFPDDMHSHGHIDEGFLNSEKVDIALSAWLSN